MKLKKNKLFFSQHAARVLDACRRRTSASLEPLTHGYVLMKSPRGGPTFRIKRFAWQLLTAEAQRGIMHFDIG